MRAVQQRHLDHRRRCNGRSQRRGQRAETLQRGVEDVEPETKAALGNQIGGPFGYWTVHPAVRNEDSRHRRARDGQRTQTIEPIASGIFAIGTEQRAFIEALPFLNLKGTNGAGFDLLGYAVTLTLSGDREDCQRQVEAVRLLLEAGMDPNQSRDRDGTPIFSVLSFHLGEPPAQQVFRLFVEHGANPNGLDGKKPPIFNTWECVDCVRALLDHGSNLEIRDENDDTPLLFYLFNGRWEAALLLLERGADLRVQNKQGMTVDAALENQKRYIQEPVPGAYLKLMTALERRRAAEVH